MPATSRSHTSELGVASGPVQFSHPMKGATASLQRYYHQQTPHTPPYQLAVNEAKVRLNLAVCPGAWLMPARMVIITGSIVGYNNALKQAKAGMKLGINNDVNLGTKKAALQLMDGGPSKINPPNSHPSNPIHKAAMAAQNPKPAAQKPAAADEALETQTETPQHEINKTAVIVGVVGVVALIFIATR